MSSPISCQIWQSHSQWENVWLPPARLHDGFFTFAIRSHLFLWVIHIMATCFTQKLGSVTHLSSRQYTLLTRRDLILIHREVELIPDEWRHYLHGDYEMRHYKIFIIQGRETEEKARWWALKEMWSKWFLVSGVACEEVTNGEKCNASREVVWRGDDAFPLWREDWVLRLQKKLR